MGEFYILELVFPLWKVSVVVSVLFNFTVRRRVTTQVVSLLLWLVSTKRGKEEAFSLPTALAHFAPVLQGVSCQPGGTDDLSTKCLLYEKPHAWPIGMLVANEDQRLILLCVHTLPCVVGRITHACRQAGRHARTHTRSHARTHQDVQVLISKPMSMLHYMAERTLKMWLRLRTFKMSGFAWVIHMGPVQLYESLKAESLFWLWSEREEWMTEIAGEIWSMKRTPLVVGGFGDGGRESGTMHLKQHGKGFCLRTSPDHPWIWFQWVLCWPSDLQNCEITHLYYFKH